MAQVELLVSEVREHKVLTHVLAYTGLRWGEATGLRVGSVDIKRRRFLVDENAVMVGSHVHVGSPKSHEQRSVPYPAFLDSSIAGLCDGRPGGELLFGNGHTH